MSQVSHQHRPRELTNCLNFSQEQVVFFLGYSLRSVYSDVLEADLPEDLKALVLKLEEQYPP